MTAYTKKLIEVALPLDAINRESAREKTIRHGHPSTLHLWWARRPLAACRAVIFASLVDDPSAHPDQFPSEESQEAERQRLFRIVEELVKWENRANEAVLNAARAEILRSTNGNPPPVFDPFCGGGSIPLEAQRLGLEALGSDLNPVAVLINKALVEIPPRFANRPPVNPGVRDQLAGVGWSGVDGLVNDVHYYGQWMSDEAFSRVGDLYPKATLPTSGGGGEAKVIAWLWARTAGCINPACQAEVPLLNGFTLSRRKGQETFLVPRIDAQAKTVAFEVRTGSRAPAEGTISRTGARCLVCGANLPLADVREQGCRGEMGDRLVAIVAEGRRGRLYLEADSKHEATARVQAPVDVLTTSLPVAALGFRVQGYGITKHSQLFTHRQLRMLDTFCGLVGEATEKARQDGASEDYATAIGAYLTLSIGRLANRSSSQSFWHPNRGTVEQVFARNALPMIWVFAEGNPFSDSSGNFLGQLGYLENALLGTPAVGKAVVEQRDARTVDSDAPVHVVTDPPYYDNVPYADLSDFFYVWLRRAGKQFFPDLFSTLLVPKAQELIAEPARQGNARAAKEYFEVGLSEVFDRVHSMQSDESPAILFYAFKQAEDDAQEGGRASTGWDTMLSALLDKGFTITATWPVRTEQPGGLREHGRNSLASSIVIACRKRAETAAMATRREFLAALKAELPVALKTLQHGNIAPVDLAQASIGPGIGIFSRYSLVREADGSPMTVHTALALIDQVLGGAVAEQEGEFDADTRWAISWFEEVGTDAGQFGRAEVLSRAKNCSVQGLVEARIVEAKGGKVRLLRRDELDEDWNPETDKRLTVWEMTQHLIRRLDDGEPAAAALARRLGSNAEVARDLAYRLYVICDHKRWAQEALAYNGLVVAWPQIQRLTAAEPATAGPSQTSFEV